MELIRVKTEEFSAVYREMEKNFIPEERRDEADARAALENPLYALYHTVDDGKRVGFVSTWQFEDFLFVEHLVTYEEFRGCGYGRRTLDCLKEFGFPIVLEVEPPTTETAKGRIEFYKKVGFCLNDYAYFQPPYRVGGEGVEMILMSYPLALDEPEHVKDALYRTVYHVKENPYES
ncbi:MAG: GNAT family N-acetyltransferase [Clostridia bacterium]|nr:GNAT family N-acetyltransferase [Clostridia bacterium]